MTDLDAGRDATRTASDDPQFEQYRGELIGYCYRMMGSAFEAEDAVQETMVRAWRNFDTFEGRSAVRTWLYRIATNICLDMATSRQRRARPMDLSSPSRADWALDAGLPESTWIQPIPDASVLSDIADPGEQAVARETIRLAFIAALQHLPPRQRAVLILFEVLNWHATEVAELLGTSVASVNSALQRARATLADADIAMDAPARPLDPAQQALLVRYIDAFERYDLDSLATMLHADVVMSMPPYALWLRGRDQFCAWMSGTGKECEGSRLIAVQANGSLAYAQYRATEGGGHHAWALGVLSVEDGIVTELISFLDTANLFPMFGLPLTLAD